MYLWHRSRSRAFLGVQRFPILAKIENLTNESILSLPRFIGSNCRPGINEEQNREIHPKNKRIICRKNSYGKFFWSI